MMILKSWAYRWLGLIEVSWKYTRFTWLEVSFEPRPAVALELINFGDDYEGHFSFKFALGWPVVYLRLPFGRRQPQGDMLDGWGFTTGPDGASELHLNWGDRCRIVHLPWSWGWHRTSYLMADGSWLDETRRDRLASDDTYEHYCAIRDKRTADQWSETYDYRYTLRNGTVQERKAKVTMREMESRRRMLRWTGLGARVVRSIDFEFSDEVGERSGTWKGGCIASGEAMRPGETPLDTFRRMERERRF